MRDFFSPSAHLILLIGDEGTLCAPYYMGDMEPFFVAARDPASTARVVAMAEENPALPITLLADHLAQDFRADTLPRLNFFDRAKLIKRRLKQAFPQARLTASLPVRHDHSQILLAGMQDGGLPFEWLRRLTAARPANPPRIALAPIECAGLVTQLLPQAKEDWGLLLSRQRSGGFRQIVTHKGELVFTRLTPPLPAHSTAKEITDSIARDVQASRGYLGRLGLHEGEKLHAAILAPETMHTELIKLPVEDPLLISPYKAALDLDLPFMPDRNDPHGDIVFAGWLAMKKKPRLVLMPPDLQQAKNEALIKRWGLRGAVAALLLAIGLTAWDADDVFNTLLAREQESEHLVRLKKEFAQEETDAAPVTEPLGRLRLALGRKHLFESEQAEPWPVLRALGNQLGTGARIVKFDWQDNDGKPASAQLQLDMKLAEPTDVGNREATVSQFKQLTQNLAGAVPGYDVRVVRYPFPAMPHEALTNATPTGGKDAVDTTAQISITPKAGL